jgi:hypothetical protein
VVLFFGPLLFRQQVLYPHDNGHELGLLEASDAGTVSTREYSDQSLTYIPELHHNLHGQAAGWLSTWNPHVELGRPSFQFFGLGRAFLLTRIVAWFEDDAFRNYTLSAVLALALSVLFGYRFLDSLGLCRSAARGAGESEFWQCPEEVCGRGAGTMESLQAAAGASTPW